MGERGAGTHSLTENTAKGKERQWVHFKSTSYVLVLFLDLDENIIGVWKVGRRIAKNLGKEKSCTLRIGTAIITAATQIFLGHVFQMGTFLSFLNKIDYWNTPYVYTLRMMAEQVGTRLTLMTRQMKLS